MTNIAYKEGLSFDDVLLVPEFSAILPDEVNTVTRLTRNLELNIPIVSAAMDTVTEAHTAISMARAGGIGFIHRNLTVEEQVVEVDRVKKSESGMIVDPITISPDVSISEVLAIMAKYRISGIPVTQGDKLVGIVTNRDLRFETELEKPASAVMTKENLVTVPEGVTLEESKKMLHQHRIEKLLVVDSQGKLKGLITIKDIEKIRKYPNACKDSMGRLRAGAAIGVGSDMMVRTEALLKAGADVLVIDTSHGHSQNVISAVQSIKTPFQIARSSQATWPRQRGPRH
jgi:IMP dehydrogenase